MSDDLMKMILKAHKKSYKKAFEVAVQTGTCLIYSSNGKIIKIKPQFKYKLVPITPRKKNKKKA